MPKKQLLSGLGPDKLEYIVSEAKDRYSLLICCGRGKGRVLRLKRPEGVLTHELVFRRIAESLNIGALDSENTSDPSRGAAAEKMTLSEGHTFTADLLETRSRQKRDFFTMMPEEAGADASVNRDFPAVSKIHAGM